MSRHKNKARLSRLIKPFAISIKKSYKPLQFVDSARVTKPLIVWNAVAIIVNMIHGTVRTGCFVQSHFNVPELGRKYAQDDYD